MAYSYDRRDRMGSTDRWYQHIDENKMTAWTQEMYFNDSLGKDDDEVYEERKVKFEWVICDTCNGKGQHVNPSIDSGGISADEFYDDPDFRESYFEGHYDTTCFECGGRRVVPVTTDEVATNAIAQWEQDQWDSYDECRYKQMMGC